MRPLAGLNIAITRPRDQAGALAQAIEQQGGHALLFPLIDISPASDARAVQAIVQRLAEFDLAIFISPNAVRYGMAAIRAAGEVPRDLRFAAVGQGSAKILHEMGVAAVIVPRQGADSEALLALPELQEVRGWHIVIFRGNGGRELLGDALQARGAEIEYAECYQRGKPAWQGAELMAARPDALIVTSSEALENLLELVDTTARVRLQAVPLFVIHERIATTAHRLGWQRTIVSRADDEALLSSLRDWARDGGLRG